MKQTALITGGTGFLGRHLGIALKDRYRAVLRGRNNKHNMDTQRFTGCVTLPMDVTDDLWVDTWSSPIGLRSISRASKWLV